MSFIRLRHRGDRTGNNIINYIAQINYAHKNSYGIFYIKQDVKYYESPFIKCLIDIIDNFINIDKEFINEQFNPASIPGPGDGDMNDILSQVVRNIESDLYTYFKKNILYQRRFETAPLVGAIVQTGNLVDVLSAERIESFKGVENCKQCNKFEINSDNQNTIYIHIRMPDIGQNNDNWPDYDGSVCGNYYKKLIENNETAKYTNLYNNYYNKQSPLSASKLNKVVNELQKKYPNDDVTIIVNPEVNELPEFNFKYNLIKSDDYNDDLLILSTCKKIVLSRSMFAVSSLFFGEHTDVYMPIWGHFVCCGFDTKYDNTNNIKYFY